VRAVHVEGEERETLYAEDLLDAGQVDAVLPREAMRDYLLRAVRLLRPMPGADPERLPPFVQARGLERGWTSVERARAQGRPRALRFIEGLASDYLELHGDRSGVDDPAMVGGLDRIGETNVVVVGQERGDLDERGERRNGRAGPAGYRKAKRLMNLAQRLGLPLVTFVDTPGAHDGIADEWGGLAASISDCLATMAAMTVPTVAVVIGEGGSGGALALTMADRILMLQNAMYAITSPEGAAAILFRDRGRAAEVAEALGVAAMDLHQLGVVDTIVSEPTGGAHTDPQAAVRMLEPELRRALAEAMRGRGTARRSRREVRLRRIGREPGRIRYAATMLQGATDTAVHVLGQGVQAGVQAIGSRILRRGRTAEESEATTTAAN
jgi:acetyl-CoA carboxylase carboxyl transferase subunit beta